MSLIKSSEKVNFEFNKDFINIFSDKINSTDIPTNAEPNS